MTIKPMSMEEWQRQVQEARDNTTVEESLEAADTEPTNGDNVGCLRALAREVRRLRAELQAAKAELEHVTQQRDDAEAQLRSALEQGHREADVLDSLRKQVEELEAWNDRLARPFVEQPPIAPLTTMQQRFGEMVAERIGLQKQVADLREELEEAKHFGTYEAHAETLGQLMSLLDAAQRTVDAVEKWPGDGMHQDMGWFENLKLTLNEKPVPPWIGPSVHEQLRQAKAEVTSMNDRMEHIISCADFLLEAHDDNGRGLVEGVARLRSAVRSAKAGKR